MKVSEFFKVITTRPLNALNKISIAELAQYSDIGGIKSNNPIADAEAILRKEWIFEIDADHKLNHLDGNSARLVFKDGSTLSFLVKKTHKEYTFNFRPYFV